MATSGDLARKTSEMRKGHSARGTDKTSLRNAAPTWKHCDRVKADGGVLISMTNGKQRLLRARNTSDGTRAQARDSTG